MWQAGGISLHMRLTTPIAMVRFVGNGLHPTDYTRIDEWVERIVSWQKMGLREVYFFTHEPDNLLAPDIAKVFVGTVEKAVIILLHEDHQFYDDGVGGADEFVLEGMMGVIIGN